FDFIEALAVVSGWEWAAQKGSKPEGPGRAKRGPVLAQEPGAAPSWGGAAQTRPDKPGRGYRHTMTYWNCSNSINEVRRSTASRSIPCPDSHGFQWPDYGRGSLQTAASG